MFKLSRLTALGVLLIITGCSKSGSNHPQTPDTSASPHVYIGGYSGDGGSASQGVVWKNGFAENKPGTNNITAIAVSGSDIYALQGNTYWKNGVAVTIPEIHTSSGIAVSGTDVYISCTTLTSDSGGIGKAGVLYWKNGTFVNLTENIPDVSGASSSGISVSGNDVYVSGSFFSPSYPPLQGTYWKNGQLITLPQNAYGTKCITASGNDVYLASQSAASTGEVLWKNGIAQMLGPHTKVYDIFVSGSDVYVAGFDGTGADNADYWKNGQPVTLSGGWMTTGIFVYGNDVYCSGLGYPFSAVFWKNGSVKTLADPGQTTGIGVVP